MKFFALKKSAAAWLLAIAISGVLVHVDGQVTNDAGLQHVLDNSDNESLYNRFDSSVMNDQHGMLRYLKGAPKPAWMDKGIPFIEREKEKEQYRAPAKAAAAASGNGGK